MSTCKTCVWWDSHEWNKTIRRQCNHEALNKNADESCGLSDAGCSYEQSTILTGPDFGCIHHRLSQEAFDKGQA